MTDSELQQTTWSTSRGNVSQYNLGKLPPAVHVSHNQEMVGKQYGWIEIVHPQKRWKKNWQDPRVLGQCTSCGRISWVHFYNLKSGKSKGCQSCSQKRQVPKWLDRRMTAAKQRCTNPKDSNYENYGARGIEFRFDSVLEAGLHMMSLTKNLNRDLEIDRIDVNGHYEKGNMQWVTHQQNCQNQRRYMTY